MTRSLFSISEALEFFEQKHNYRGISSCFMILACIYSSQICDTSRRSKRSLLDAVLYLSEAERVMNKVIQRQKIKHK